MIVEIKGKGEVEFPDTMTDQEIADVLKNNPPFEEDGKDVAAKLASDIYFGPTPEQYKKYEDWKEKQQTSFIDGFVKAVPEMAGKVGKGLMGLMDITHYIGTGKDPVSTLGEAFAQGSYQLYGLVAESTNPDSPAFKFQNLIFGDGSFESRYNQFMEARRYQRKLAKQESGEEPALTSRAVPQVASNLSVITDPTMALVFLKPLALSGKLGAYAAKAAEGVSAVESAAAKIAAKAAEKSGAVIQSAGSATAGAVESGVNRLAQMVDVVSPKSTAGRIGLGSALGAGVVSMPGVATKAATVYGAAKAAEVGGELLSEAGRIAGAGPTRLSTLEQLAASQTLSPTAKTVAGVAAKLDPAIQLASPAAVGAAEGAAIGSGLGYYATGTAEGSGEGAGSGAVLGAIGRAAGGALDRLAGLSRPDVIRSEMVKDIESAPEPQRPLMSKAYERLSKSGSHEAVAELIDVRRWLQKQGVEFEFVDSATAPEVFSKNFPGQKYVTSQGFAGVNESGKPSVFINADLVKPGTGFHEALHGAVRTAVGKEFGQKMGQWIEENLSTDQIESLVSDYVRKASPRDREALSHALNRFAPGGRDIALEEISADMFSKFLSKSEFRDYMLRGKQDWGGKFISLAKDTIGKLTDSIGYTDFRGQRGFERIAKEMINAQRNIARTEIREGRKPVPTNIEKMSPKDLETWADKNGQTDVLDRDQSGNTVGVKPEAEVKAARVEKSERIFKTISEHAIKAGAKPSKPEGAIKLNRRMLEKYKDAIPEADLKKLDVIFNAIQNGDVIRWNSYFPEFRKKKQSETSEKANRGEVQITGIPYEVAIKKKGGLFVRILDLDTLKNRADDFLGREGMLKPWNGNKEAALADISAYIKNLHSEKPKPSVEVLGDARKRDIIYKIVGSKLRLDQEGTVINDPSTGINTRQENQAGTETTIGIPDGLQGNNTAPINSLSLDKMGHFEVTGERLGFGLGAYELSKVNWLPSESIGGVEVIKSDSGLKIIHGNRWRLYDQTGKLVGVYGTEAEAIKKADKISK